MCLIVSALVRFDQFITQSYHMHSGKPHSNVVWVWLFIIGIFYMMGFGTCYSCGLVRIDALQGTFMVCVCVLNCLLLCVTVWLFDLSWLWVTWWMCVTACLCVIVWVCVTVWLCDSVTDLRLELSHQLGHQLCGMFLVLGQGEVDEGGGIPIYRVSLGDIVEIYWLCNVI